MAVYFSEFSRAKYLFGPSYEYFQGGCREMQGDSGGFRGMQWGCKGCNGMQGDARGCSGNVGRCRVCRGMQGDAIAG